MPLTLNLSVHNSSHLEFRTFRAQPPMRATSTTAPMIHPFMRAGRSYSPAFCGPLSAIRHSLCTRALHTSLIMRLPSHKERKPASRKHHDRNPTLMLAQTRPLCRPACLIWRLPRQPAAGGPTVVPGRHGQQAYTRASAVSAISSAPACSKICLARARSSRSSACTEMRMLPSRIFPS